MKTNKKVLAERLKLLRESHELSQTEFALKAGMSQAAVAQFEGGQRFPSMVSLIKIADCFGFSVTELLGNGNDKDSAKGMTIASIANKLKDLQMEDILLIDRLLNRIVKNET